MSPVPCSCCPVDLQGCALVSVQFDSAAETVPQAGWNQVNLAATADGITNTTALSGYNTAVGNTPSAALRITYTIATPQNRVRGVRVWNQAGGDLGDADGLNRFTAEFYAGAVLLATETWQIGNGGAAFTRTLPNGLELNGVTSVVLRTLDKQIGGSVAPLWREFQLLEFQPVYACRHRTGPLEWYDASGNLVANGDVITCETPPQPWVPDSIVMTTGAWGDDVSGTGENACNIVPAPASMVGFTPSGPGCFDPVLGVNSMTWGPTSSIEMEYDSSVAGSGAVLSTFTVPGHTITWPVSAFQMAPGETVMSNVIPGGRRAILTYVSGPAQNSASGTIQISSATQIRIHGLNISSVAPIRFRIDFVTA